MDASIAAGLWVCQDSRRFVISQQYLYNRADEAEQLDTLRGFWHTPVEVCGDFLKRFGELLAGEAESA